MPEHAQCHGEVSPLAACSRKEKRSPELTKGQTAPALYGPLPGSHSTQDLPMSTRVFLLKAGSLTTSS